MLMRAYLVTRLVTRPSFVKGVLAADMVECQIAAILLVLAGVNFKIFEGETPQSCAPNLLQHAKLQRSSAFQAIRTHLHSTLDVQVHAQTML